MNYPRGRSPLERLSPDSLWVLVDHLDYPEVHNLSRCSRTLHQNVDFFLYTREMQDGQYGALHYAVDEMQDAVGVQTITKLARYVRPENSIAYFNTLYDHGDGCAHALHIAATRDNLEQVRKLLELGADAGAMCRNPTALLSGGQLQTLRAINLDKVLEDCEWKAMLIPFICQYRPLGLLLHQHARSSILAQCIYRADRAVTLFHIAVLQNRPNLMAGALRAHLDDVNIQMAKSGQTPLHLAISNEMPILFDTLVHHSRLNGLFNREGANVLHLAIEEIYMTAHPPTRRWLAQVVKRLLDQGADPNEPKYDPLCQTPLLLATDAVRYDWYRVWREVKFVIDLLLQNGADVNKANTNGSTPLTTVVKRVIGENDRGSMKTMFLDLIKNHGADINLRPQFAGQPLKSITFRLINAPSMVTLCKEVIALGGTIAQHEVPRVFAKWYQCSA
ncbi:hypothetical protein LCI18_000746 [Fusarium solani-melongenae]|uniref:Uncharacterized protein n=1 Tax=Fusarium solani subsp. cucurbitae TaxID=2747967 RepID=A0ACD3YMI6_FUSSC|nr:hypothetical protein LCI18_000746 [Fusarium solani-melongenae]